MKIAAVSMTYNDDYKLDEWKEHYLDFKDDIEWFIIVDNNSKKEYLNRVKKEFSDSIIIERNTNGGCTAAYNDGIRYALEYTDCDAIAVIGNDIKLSKNCLPILHNYLFSDDSLGIVSTAMLDIDSDIIDCYGHKIKFFNVINENKGEKIGNVKCHYKYTDLVTGGFTLARREFYEKCGLQDERLFMYCDELDTALKAKKNGYKLGVISSVYIWHWHINNPLQKITKPSPSYLIARNRLYLSNKYYSKFNSLMWFGYYGLIRPIEYIIIACIRMNKKYFSMAQYSYIGAKNGFKGDMKYNKYMEFM